MPNGEKPAWYSLPLAGGYPCSVCGKDFISYEAASLHWEHICFSLPHQTKVRTEFFLVRWFEPLLKWVLWRPIWVESVLHSLLRLLALALYGKDQQYRGDVEVYVVGQIQPHVLRNAFLYPKTPLGMKVNELLEKAMRPYWMWDRKQWWFTHQLWVKTNEERLEALIKKHDCPKYLVDRIPVYKKWTMVQRYHSRPFHTTFWTLSGYVSNAANLIKEKTEYELRR